MYVYTYQETIMTVSIFITYKIHTESNVMMCHFAFSIRSQMTDVRARHILAMKPSFGQPKTSSAARTTLPFAISALPLTALFNKHDRPHAREMLRRICATSYGHVTELLFPRRCSVRSPFFNFRFSTAIRSSLMT